MKIVEPYAKLVDFTHEDGIKALRKIEAIGRVSHRSEDRQTEDSYDRFIRTVVIGHGDLSIVEHVSVTVEAEVDRGITHEWVRHRLFSYTQESTRFVNYDKTGRELRFIRPPIVEASTGSWVRAMEVASTHYRGLLAAGYPPQTARSVLPNALSSKLIITGNLRSWRHFLIMRTSKETHPQMKQVTVPLLAEFQAKVPILFEDIAAESKQSEAMRLLR